MLSDYLIVHDVFSLLPVTMIVNGRTISMTSNERENEVLLLTLDFILPTVFV